MGAGDDAHTAVFGRGIRAGEPEGGDFHRFERPVAAVLVPEHGAASFGGFGNVVRGKKGQVRADEDFGEIEQTRVRNEPVPKRVADHQVVVEVLGSEFGVLGEEPIHVVASFLGEVPVDHFSGDDVAVVVVGLAKFVRVVARHGECSTKFSARNVSW